MRSEEGKGVRGSGGGVRSEEGEEVRSEEGGVRSEGGVRRGRRGRGSE